ncbi:MAG: PAS domain S-box protein [Proteobacteria bacterium]|nr:PAS domain S-box protein [Pseudomonadota bacterium]
MSSFSGLLSNAALMLVLCVIYDTFGIYSIAQKNLRDCFTGALVGLFSIIVMLNPWSLQPGVFFDTRWVLLSLCGLFFGFRPTFVAVIIAGSFRLYQGGTGGIVGTVVIVVTAFVGVAWKYWKDKNDKPLGWKDLYLFGVLVQLAMLSCMVLMPAGMFLPIIKSVATPILTIYPVLTLIVGMVLNRQEVRRNNEKELAENRKALFRERGLLRGVINSIPDLIVFKDTAGAYLGCNKSFESFVGTQEELMIGKTAFDFFDSDTAELILHKEDEVFATGETVTHEEWVKGPDGKRVLLDIVKTPFKGLDGTVSGLVGISRDITERKEAENKLAEEKERLAVTLRSIGDGVITTDVQGNVVLLNKVAENLTGWIQSEACGRPLTEIFHTINEQTREKCENPVAKVISGGRIIGLANHTALIAKDGTERSIADSGAPISDLEGNIIGVVLVFRDVTQEIKTEKELLKIKKLESIGILAGGIAHDFNNILTAILGNINIALFDSDLGDDTREILSEAEKASIRAKNLALQLLTFAKGGNPVKETSSLKSVIQDAAGFALRGDKIVCRYDIPDNLWLVDIDKGQIGQVIQNVVLNASQAMPKGGAITVSCENLSSSEGTNGGYHFHPTLLEQGKFVKICIQDNGIGIPANVIDRIFDPYFSTKQEGSGLGLSITHSIINNHDGYVSVESTPGAGTAFTFCLPASNQILEEKQEDEGVRTSSSQLKILVMDDEEMVRKVVKTMLMRLGHEVGLAEHGEEAIKMYRHGLETKQRFDLVLMDLTIPGGMGGKDAAREILSLDPDAKIIVSSGYSDDPIISKYDEFGFCAAIVKPYLLKELSKVVARITNG